MRRRSIHLIASTFAVLALAACSGGKSSPDFGGEEDGFEEVSDDIVEDPGVDPGTDIGGDEGAEDIGPTDPGGDTGPVRCQTNADCADVPMTLDPCRRKVCLKPANICGQDWDTTCCFDGEFLFQGFENGLGGWAVDDPNTQDKVTWSVVGHRRAQGQKSLYLGDPTCRTYYNGPLDANCDPQDRAGNAGTSIRAAVTSPFFEIPPLSASATTFVASMYLWVDTEPFVAQIGEQPDLLRVLAVPKGGLPDEYTELFTTAAIERTTRGNFLHIVSNVGEFAGREMALRLVFDSLDGANNHFEGIYIDDVRVYSTCVATCAAGGACEDDGDACTDDSCREFTNQDSVGTCAYPRTPACLEPVCAAATATADCPNIDPCATVSCPDGACHYVVTPEDQCCLHQELFGADFDDGSLDMFNIWTYLNNPNVKWQLATHRSVSGGYSLYYGNTAALNYVTGVGVSNFGEATGPVIDLPSKGFYFLSFNLFLSTEFDDVAHDAYMNPLGVDFFEVIVVENVGTVNEKTTTVWSSHYLYGSSGNQFVPVGVDLSGFAGKSVSIRFRFDTSDDQKNNYEGVYVDDIRVTRDTCVQRNCGGLHDCMIDGFCRTGTCANEVCNVTVVGEPPTCCASVVQCDDGNPCTADACVQRQCVHDFFEMPGCCLALTVAEHAFDAGSTLDGVTVVDQGTPGTGGMATGWISSDARYRSAPRSMRFGNAANYDNGGIAKGTATLPAVTLPLFGDFRLHFWAYLDIENAPGRDLLAVDILWGEQTAQVFSKDSFPSDGYAQWREVGPIDLNAYRGQSIRVRFRFDSVDETGNLGEGVFIDDVQIRKVCP